MLTYLWNVMVYAVTFAYGRYNVSLLTMWYLIIGLGLGALILRLSERKKKINESGLPP